MISVCGVICTDCDFFKNSACAGCEVIQGKVFWAKEVGVEACPIYDCCTGVKKLAHCGKCPDLPCEIYYDTQDPSLSEEEHISQVRQRVEILKKRD